MNKGVIYILFSLTFYLRLFTIGYVMKITESAKMDQFRSIFFKAILMNTYSYCYIFYILITKNLLQLRLYKILLLFNMVDVYFLFTYLGVKYYIFFIYQVLIIMDILIEMYSVRKFYLEFMKHYVRKIGMSFIKYKQYVVRQKAILCIIIYFLNFLIDLFYDWTNIDKSKFIMFIVFYLAFVRRHVTKKAITGTIFCKLLHLILNLRIFYTRSNMHNVGILYRAVFKQGISTGIKEIKDNVAIDINIVNVLCDTYEFGLLIFLMYYNIIID